MTKVKPLMHQHTEIVKDLGYFAASHTLPNHHGGCANLHGHNYGVKVCVALLEDRYGSLDAGEGSPSRGMVIDFSMLKNIYKNNIHPLVDHAMIFGEHKPFWYKQYVEMYSKLQSVDLLTARREVDRNLGNVTHLDIPETTAECLATWMFGEFERYLTSEKENLRVLYVEITETETSIARAFACDWREFPEHPNLFGESRS